MRGLHHFPQHTAHKAAARLQAPEGTHRRAATKTFHA